MEMTPPDGARTADGGHDADSLSAAQADLHVATADLRRHIDERWVEVAHGVLSHVLAQTRPSHPVRGRVGSASFHVSEQVLTAYLLDALSTIPELAVDAIRVHADRDLFTGVTIVVTARYGLPLLPLADLVRDIARRRLVEVLGDPAPPVTVSTMHVHVEDVTPGDPDLE